MKTAKNKSLILTTVILVALSTTFAHIPAAVASYYAPVPQDTVKAKKPLIKRNDNTNVNGSTNGRDLNNSGSAAEVRHERTGSLNPYSTGTVKSHEGTQGSTGPSGK